MNASEYQKLAARTLIEKPYFRLSDRETMILWNAIGLAGEAGEVNEDVKKGILHRHGLDEQRLAKELGDCMWYIAALCTIIGVDMGDIMQDNIDKLKKRYPEGFTSEDSQKRIDTKDG